MSIFPTVLLFFKIQYTILAFSQNCIFLKGCQFSDSHAEYSNFVMLVKENNKTNVSILCFGDKSHKEIFDQGIPLDTGPLWCGSVMNYNCLMVLGKLHVYIYKMG